MTLDQRGQHVAGGNFAGGDIACAVPAPGAVRLLIGDVMGHGPRAAATAAAVTAEFRARAARPGPLHEIATRLHEFVACRPGHPSAWGEEFVTAQLVEVPCDPDTPARIVCCGHPPPLLLRACTAMATPLDEFADAAPQGLPLGLLGLGACPVQVCEIPAAAGDALLFYTDGVSEACDGAGQPYPLAERAAALAARQPAVGGQPLPERILADLRCHVGPSPLRDDATLLHLQLAHAPLAVSVAPDPGTTRPQIVRS